jgi:hypothetical protein
VGAPVFIAVRCIAAIRAAGTAYESINHEGRKMGKSALPVETPGSLLVHFYWQNLPVKHSWSWPLKIYIETCRSYRRRYSQFILCHAGLQCGSVHSSDFEASEPNVFRGEMSAGTSRSFNEVKGSLALEEEGI